MVRVQNPCSPKIRSVIVTVGAKTGGRGLTFRLIHVRVGSKNFPLEHQLSGRSLILIIILEVGSVRVIQENDHPVAIGCLGKFQDIMDGLFVAAL
jgi:hypothetical protein